MKKIITIGATVLAGLSLTACAKKINGVKTYKTEVANKVIPAAGSGNCNSGLMKIHGTTSAPNGYEIMAINNKGKSNLVGNDSSMQSVAQVKNGKFTGYIDPLEENAHAKKGEKLTYHVIAVKNSDDLGQKDNKAIKQQVDKKYQSTTFKLSFDPTTSYVETKVQKVLGKGAEVAKRSKTVYTITPKKDSDLENEVSKAMYGDTDQWPDITKQLNNLSSHIKTPAGRVALVLMNPENHKKFLLVSIGGKTKFDAIKSGTVNSDASKLSSTNNSNAKNANGSAGASDSSDGDDFELGVILGWLIAYDEEYGYDDSADYNDDSSYDDNYSDDNADFDDNYDYSDDSDDDSSNSDDFQNSVSSPRPAESSSSPSIDDEF